MPPCVATLASKLNEFFAAVGGECKDFTIEPSETPSSRQTSIGLVKAALRRIKPNKATNTDDYPAWITKEFADVLCIPMTRIINKMLAQRKFPNKWKMAEIKRLPKIH